jgi:hypothetical protein
VSTVGRTSWHVQAVGKDHSLGVFEVRGRSLHALELLEAPILISSIAVSGLLLEHLVVV